MPISRSPKRGTKPAAVSPPSRPRYVRPFIWIVVSAVLAVIVIALPASIIKRYLPANLGAEDFSGTVWHGSAGTVTANARNVGAVEWRIHPGALLRLTLSADVHWVKGGVVADGMAEVSPHTLALHDVQGGGPIEDLSDLGIPAGWHGNSTFKVGVIEATLAPAGAVTLVSAVGDVTVSNVASPQIADGADLGGYTLHVANGAITPNADATAELRDTGGPVEVAAIIHLSADGHTAMLSGTLKERPNAPAALHSQLENLAQLQRRDAQGRIPVELEFTL